MLKKKLGVAPICNPNIQDADTGLLQLWKVTLGYTTNTGIPRTTDETLSQNKDKNKNKKRKKSGMHALYSGAHLLTKESKHSTLNNCT